MYRKITIAILALGAIATTILACAIKRDRINDIKISAAIPATQAQEVKPANPQPSKNQTRATQQVQFICGQGFDKQTNRRLPTTFAWTERGKIAIVRWKTEQFPNYPPERRCQEVSPRFQEAYNSGTLNFITNGKMNGQSVICTATEYGGKCRTLLMTLRSQDNSLEILNEFKDILNGRSTGPIVHSSGSPQAYYTIDMETFLRTAPVEEE